MVEVQGKPLDNPDFPRDFTERKILCCPVCGWWLLRKDVHGKDNAGAYAFTNTYGAIGSLKELAVSNSLAPINEVRAYLAARYEKRGEVNPSVFEEVVASIYRNLGYSKVRVTGQTNDGGIDIVMEGAGDTLIGVQVKRYRNKIQAEQIRAFTGALMLKGMTHGIFLTTSEYTKGARDTANAATGKGYRVELINARAFYDALGVAQRKMYKSSMDPAAPYFSTQLHHIRYKKAYLH
jgi:restriction system protein